MKDIKSLFFDKHKYLKKFFQNFYTLNNNLLKIKIK